MDLQLVFDAEAVAADLALDGADLATDEGLQTAVLVSLFTDRRAEPDDALPDGGTDRRGWWADAYADSGDRIGSRLWLLDRAKLTAATLAAARQYAEEALAWMVEDGVADRIEVSAESPRVNQLALAVTITRPATPPARYRFERFWNAL